MTRLIVQPCERLSGEIRVAGDKSISHRALLLGALAEGKSVIEGFLRGEDCLATLGCLRAMGIRIDEDGGRIVVHGAGLDGLSEPAGDLDCVRSGTAMRILMGLLAGQRFDSRLTGDTQLLRRPMRRVAEPLAHMGAEISTTDGCAPVTIRGRRLQGMDYYMSVPSAQVKSAVLLAGMYAEGGTTVRQPAPTRDHTERMLAGMGAPLREDGLTVTIRRPERLRALGGADGRPYRVPGDFSSAAFPLVAGCLVPQAQFRIPGVGVNPTRTGLLDVLRSMGAAVQCENETVQGNAGEPAADLLPQPSSLHAIEVCGEVVVRMIDEFPVFAVAATQAEGTTLVKDAQELRVKETDRIATVVEELTKMGAQIRATQDGFIVEGRTALRGGHVDSHGDHRLAMALTVAGLIAQDETIIEDAACIPDSFPGFLDLMRALGARVREEA